MRLSTKKCDLTQDKNFHFGLEKVIQNEMKYLDDIYAVGKADKHLRHRQVSLVGKSDVSRFSISKHQQVDLPKLISHCAGC